MYIDKNFQDVSKLAPSISICTNVPSPVDNNDNTKSYMLLNISPVYSTVDPTLVNIAVNPLNISSIDGKEYVNSFSMNTTRNEKAITSTPKVSIVFLKRDMKLLSPNFI